MHTITRESVGVALTLVQMCHITHKGKNFQTEKRDPETSAYNSLGESRFILVKGYVKLGHGNAYYIDVQRYVTL